MTTFWLRVKADHFVAALAVEGKKVTETAPILSYMRGWSAKKLEGYLNKKQWSHMWLRNRSSILGPIQAKEREAAT